ncbi:MAG: hypothetical protein GY696_24235 [Gammaproteobacteria bacterium]|nr:hypothetical protein [Gammaproteobacteria bacterium]
MNSQKTAKQLEWTAEIFDKMRQLKEKFVTAPIRVLPRFDLEAPFQLTTDFSSRQYLLS